MKLEKVAEVKYYKFLAKDKTTIYIPSVILGRVSAIDQALDLALLQNGEDVQEAIKEIIWDRMPQGAGEITQIVGDKALKIGVWELGEIARLCNSGTDVPNPEIPMHMIQEDSVDGVATITIGPLNPGYQIKETQTVLLKPAQETKK